MPRRRSSWRWRPGRRRLGVALLDVSTGEFTAAEYSGRRRRAGARRRDRRAPAARDRACRRRQTRRSRFRRPHRPLIAAAGVPVTAVDGWAFDAEAARRTLLDQLRAGGLEGFGLERHAGGRVGGRRARALPARHAEGRPRARPGDQLPAARRRAAHRSDHAQAPRDPRGLGGRPRRIAARRARSHGHLDGQPAAARVAAAAAASRSSRFAIGSTPSRSWRSGRPSAASSARRIKAVQDLERLVARAALGTAGPRDLVGLKQSLAVHPARARPCSPTCRRRSSGRSSPSSTTSPTSATRIERDAHRRAAGARARRRLHARRRRRRARRAAHASADPASRSSPRWKTRERARTGIASLKVRYNRVFGYYIEISKSNLHAVPARLPPEADHRRRRALHHAGAEGVRGEGARRRRAHPRARARALRGAARGRRRRGAAHPGVGARAGRARRAGGARRDAPRSTTTSSRTCTTATRWSSLDARHPVVERRTAAAGEPFVPNDITLERHDVPARRS